MENTGVHNNMGIFSIFYMEISQRVQSFLF